MKLCVFTVDIEIESDEPVDAVLPDAARPVRRDARPAEDLPFRVLRDDVRKSAGGFPAHRFRRMQPSVVGQGHQLQVHYTSNTLTNWSPNWSWNLIDCRHYSLPGWSCSCVPNEWMDEWMNEWERCEESASKSISDDVSAEALVLRIEFILISVIKHSV